MASQLPAGVDAMTIGRLLSLSTLALLATALVLTAYAEDFRFRSPTTELN